MWKNNKFIFTLKLNIKPTKFPHHGNVDNGPINGLKIKTMKKNLLTDTKERKKERKKVREKVRKKKARKT